MVLKCRAPVGPDRLADMSERRHQHAHAGSNIQDEETEEQLRLTQLQFRGFHQQPTPGSVNQ